MDESSLYEGSLAVAEAIVSDEADWPRQLVEMLAVEVGADTVGFAAWPRGRYIETRSENVGGPALSDDERRLWPAYLMACPFFRELLQHGDTRASRTSDFFPSMREFHRTEVYDQLFAPRDARFRVNFALLDDTELAIVGIYRRAHDFRREELRALEHARTPISAALAYRHAVTRLERRLPDRPRRTVALTLREEQVLRLVAAGSTNRQVGRRLDVTERTVRKHLEDIYRRLDVTNRVAASRWWIESTSRLP